MRTLTLSAKAEQLIETLAVHTHKLIQAHPDGIAMKFGMMPTSIAEGLEKQLQAAGFTKPQASEITTQIHAKCLKLANCPF